MPASRLFCRLLLRLMCLHPVVRGAMEELDAELAAMGGGDAPGSVWACSLRPDDPLRAWRWA